MRLEKGGKSLKPLSSNLKHLCPLPSILKLLWDSSPKKSLEVKEGFGYKLTTKGS
jgi:hypothetical protein